MDDSIAVREGTASEEHHVCSMGSVPFANGRKLWLSRDLQYVELYMSMPIIDYKMQKVKETKATTIVTATPAAFYK